MLRPLQTFLAAVALAIPVSSHAGDVSWTGATDDLWDTPGNWSPSGAPASADTAIFGAVPTAHTDIELSQPSYTLTSLAFQDSGFTLHAPGATTLTITGGAISSDTAQSTSNVVVPSLIVMTAADNTITVSGNVDHELELGDLNVIGAGTFTANVVSSLCLGGATAISGAFVKSGTGEVCTEGGLSAVSTTIQDGLFMVEGDSSLGNTVVSPNGSIAVMAGATASAHSVSIAGTAQVGSFSGNGEILAADQGVTIENGGSLTGFGTVQGDVHVQTGGQLAPGGSFDVGPLNIDGDVTFQINSISLFTITAPDALASSLSIAGDLTLQGILSLNHSSVAGLYTLINFTGTRTGTFSGLQDTVGGYNYNLIYNANSVQLAVTAVPEPRTWGVITGVGLLGLALLRRTRKTVVM